MGWKVNSIANIINVINIIVFVNIIIFIKGARMGIEHTFYLVKNLKIKRQDLAMHS